MSQYTVAQGDTLSKIAHKFSLRSSDEIFNYPDNAELFKKRGSKDNIKIGDVLAIPAAKKTAKTQPLVLNQNNNIVLIDPIAAPIIETDVLYITIPDSTGTDLKAGFNCLPTYTKKDSVFGVELTSITPQLNATMSSKGSTLDGGELPAGYLYIFVDGYLWRELQTIPATGNDDTAPSTVKDINLEASKGPNHWKENKYKRLPTGPSLKSVLAPTKLNYKKTVVEVGFSYTQWSWDQILKLGGMNPQDPRAEVGEQPAMAECPDTVAAASFRSARLHKLDLDNQKPCYSNGSKQDGMKTSVGPTTAQEHLAHFEPANTYTPVINYALYQAHVANQEILSCKIAMAALMAESQGITPGNAQPVPFKKEQFKLASAIAGTFFAETDHMSETLSAAQQHKPLTPAENKALDYYQDLKKWRQSELNQPKFKEFFHYNTLIKLAREIVTLRNQLVALSQKDAYIKCFEDYGYHRDTNYTDIKNPLHDLLTALSGSACQQFEYLGLNKAETDSISNSDQGEDLLLTVLGQHPIKPNHPIHRVLFPAFTGDELEDYRQNAEPQFSPYFDIQKIAQLRDTEAALDPGNTFQVSRRLVELLFTFTVTKEALGLPTTTSSLYKIGTNATKELSKINKNINKTKRQITAAGRALQEREKAVNTAKAELDQHWKQYNQELTKYNQIPSDNQANLFKQLKVEQARYGQLQLAFSKAQNEYTTAQTALAKLQKQASRTGNVTLGAAKRHALFNVMRLAGAASPGTLQAVTMPVSDYFATGGSHSNLSPLNPNFTKQIHENAIKNLKTLKTTSATNKGINASLKGSRDFAVSIDSLLNLDSDLKSQLRTLTVAQGTLAEHSKELVTVYQMHIASTQGQPIKLNALADTIKKQEQELHQAIKNAQKTGDNLDKVNKLERQLKTQQDEVERLITRFNANEKISADRLLDGQKGLSALLGVFEVINLHMCLNKFTSAPDLPSFMNLTSAVFDLAAAVLSIQKEINAAKFGEVTQAQIKNFNSPQKQVGGKVAKHVLGDNLAARILVAKWAARLNLVASLITAGIAIYDTVQALRRGDAGAAWGNGLLAGGALLLAGAAFADMLGAGTIATLFGLTIGSGGLALIGVALVLAGAGIIMLFRDKPLEAWLTNSPWGTNAGNGDQGALWLKRPDLALQDLQNLIAGPKVNTQHDTIYRDTLGTIHSSPIQYNPNPSNPIISAETTVHFNLTTGQLPPQGERDITLEFRDNANGQKLSPYQPLNPAAHNHPEVKAAIQSFFNNLAHCELERNGTGFSLSFHESALYPLLKARNSKSIDIRLSCRTYPEGKTYRSPLGPQPYCLPLPERDKNGNFKPHDPKKWPIAQAKIRIAISDGEYPATQPIQIPSQFQFE